MGGGVHEKPIQRGDCLKRGAWTVCPFRGGGGLGRKERVGVYHGGGGGGGGLISQYTLMPTS